MRWASATGYGVAVPGIAVVVGAVVVGGEVVLVVPAARRAARRSRYKIGRRPPGAMSGNLRGAPVVDVVVLELCATPVVVADAVTSAPTITAAAVRRAAR